MFMTIPGPEMGRGHRREMRRKGRLDQGRTKAFHEMHTHMDAYTSTPKPHSIELYFWRYEERRVKVSEQPTFLHL